MEAQYDLILVFRFDAFINVAIGKVKQKMHPLDFIRI